MASEEKTVRARQYDWTEENVSTVRSLRAGLWKKYEKQGMTSSRASNAASDWVAENLMNPPKTGQELDSWLGKASAMAMHASKNGHMKIAEPSSAGVQFTIPEGLTPPGSGTATMNPKWQAIHAIIRDSALETWMPFLFADERDATTASAVITGYAKRTLHCVENGWVAKTKRDKSNPFLVWAIKRKVK